MDRTDIRERILNASYGRFDLVPAIIPKETLLSSPPRIIVSLLMKELGLKKDEVPISSLRSWLFLYRKKTKRADSFGREKVNNNDKAQLPSLKGISFTDDNNSVTGKKFDF
ncbi:MAG: hypothetical protein JST58_18070 [Bacteroidetes bacterium]|nr:hypothetical protein [Bacteroidota bacterium]